MMRSVGFSRRERHFSQFLLETLDDLLAEVGPFGELLFDFLVDLNLPLVGFDLLLHLVVLVNQNFSLLRLMLQLCRQLVILQDGQMRGCLQLLVVHRQQVRLRLFDVEEHFLAQLLRLLYPVEFFLVDLLKAHGFFIG